MREADMRWCGVLFATLLCLAASFVRADDAWNGPGWYVVATQYTVILWSGPYENQDECELQKPPDGDPPDFSYSCSYLDQAPAS
jgi:hypothetical protein